MKLVILTLIATAAFTSLHASERNEYYNSLLAKAGVTPAANTVEKTSRDEYYNSLLAKMQTNGPGKSKSAVKKRDIGPEPSADAIYNAYPNQDRYFTVCHQQSPLSRLLLRSPR